MIFRDYTVWRVYQGPALVPVAAGVASAVAGTVLTSVLTSKPPKQEVSRGPAAPDEEARRKAARFAQQQLQQSSGRQSTILSNPSSDSTAKLGS